MDVLFEDFVFSGGTRQLLRGNVELHLSPKAFDLLRMLVEARPKAISKAELTDRLWPATFVGEANLSVLVAEIRAVLGDRPLSPRFIRTVQRYGYAFCGAAAVVRPPSPARASGETACWLVSGAARTPLVHGPNVVGRDPNASVWLDLPGVSRHHAQLVVEGAHVTVVDLDSKNGTYLRGERIRAAVTAADGDEIRVGPAVFTLRILSAAAPTKTE
jgi:DNA-binding winged helix-turn-helix (wHTH) protein